MNHHKTPLALAVASAIAFSIQAQASVTYDNDITYTGTNTDISEVVNTDYPYGIIIEDGSADSFDIDIQQSKVGDGVVIYNSTIGTAYIENNNGDISSTGNNSDGLGNQAILIYQSTINGGQTHATYGDNFIVINTGDIIGATDGNGGYQQSGFGIGIGGDSVITGNIANIDDDGQGSAIEGADGIRISSSTFQGNIFNEDDVNIDQATIDNMSTLDEVLQSGVSVILGDTAGIDIRNTAMTGSIYNSGHIEGGENAIKLTRQSSLDGDIVNSGTIHSADSAVYTRDTTLNGSIENLAESSDNGAGEITSISGDGIRLQHSTTTGNIVNDSSISGGLAGIRIDNSLDNTQTSTDSSFTGSITNSGTIAGGSVDSGIVISDTAFNGTINNTGTISGGDYGINIDDQTTGSVVINQSAGSISGPGAIHMNSVTRVNYTGGSISGDVENNGGTFYVEGNQTITNGGYGQAADATLALGLHKASSLTADYIDLAPGSMVLIDLSKGDLYVSNGTTVELLKVNSGEVTATDVEYKVNSTLVSVATAAINSAGNLELTFDRTSFIETASQLTSGGSLSGQASTNVTAIATILQSLDTLAQESPEIATLLNSIDGSADSFTELLPDVSGSTIAGALSASNLSSGQVSGRARGLASGDTFTKTGIWIQALGSKAKQGVRNGIAGYDSDSQGFVLGLDGELANGAILGAAYSYTNTNTDGATSSSDVDYNMLTGYWSQSFGQTLLDAQLYYAAGDNSSNRSIGAHANYDSSLYGVHTGAGYQYNLSKTAQFTPTVSLDYSHLSVDGYTETGTGAQIVDGQDYDRLELGLTGELNNTYQINQMLVTPRLTLGVYHDFKAEAQTVTAAFAVAPTSTFTIAGADPEKTRYTAGLGVELLKGENFTADVEYNFNWQSHFTAHAGAVKLRWEF